MTWALCFACGNVKFGAIVPCDECGVASTGDINLDINFSDHYLARSTLEQLGEVVKTINKATEDKELRFCSFIYYVSENHPGQLSFTPPPPLAAQVKSLLGTIEVPPVQLTRVGRGLRDNDTDSEGTGKSKQRPWWQFWKRGP